MQPYRGRVERLVGRKPITAERHRVIRQQGCDQLRPRTIGMLGDAAHQRQGLGGSADQQLLAGLQSKSNPHRDLGESIQFFLEGKAAKVASLHST